MYTVEQKDGFQIGAFQTCALWGRYVLVKQDEPSKVQVITRVFTVTPTATMPSPVTAGSPLPSQPSVLVADIQGSPLADVQCVAFSSREANFHHSAASAENARGAPDSPGAFHEKRQVPSGFVPLSKSHLEGQRLALLEGEVSQRSGADGVARWTNLAVTGSTSEAVFLCFYCEGVVACWSTATEQPTGFTPPKSPRYNPPIMLSPRAGGTGNASTTSLDVAVIFGHNLTANASSADYVDDDATELKPLVKQPRVKLTDASGAAVSGAVAIAVVTHVDGRRLPARFGGTSDATAVKPLAGFVSNPSDAAGFANFTNLRFLSSGDVPSGAGRYCVELCVDGVCSARRLCYRVKSAVAKVVVTRHPRFVRFNGTGDANAPQDGETTGQAESEPAVIRVLDENDNPVPGKSVQGIKAIRLANTTYVSELIKTYGPSDYRTVVESSVREAFKAAGIDPSRVTGQIQNILDEAEADLAEARKNPTVYGFNVGNIINPAIDQAMKDAEAAANQTRASAEAFAASLPPAGTEFTDIKVVSRDEVNAPDASGPDGFVGADVRYSYGNTTKMQLANLGLIGLVFTVDGVDSVPTGPVSWGSRTAALASNGGSTCASLQV